MDGFRVFDPQPQREYTRMPKQPIRILGLLVFLACTTTCSVGFADGWTWGPFSKASSSRDSSPLYSNTSSTKSSWMPSMKMPRMPWSSSTPRVNSYSRSNTSTWGKISKTSKRWWSKTAEVLDPYPDPKPATYSTNSDSKKSNSNWFTGWFQKQESTEPKTANEFLRQEPLK